MRKPIVGIIGAVILMAVLSSCRVGGPSPPDRGMSPAGQESVSSSAQPSVLGEDGGNSGLGPDASALGGPYTDLLGLGPEALEQRFGEPTEVYRLGERTVCWRYVSLSMGICLADGRMVVSITQEGGWIIPTLKVGDDEEQVKREIGPPLPRLTPLGEELMAIHEGAVYTVQVIVADGKASRARISLSGVDNR